MIFHPKYVPQLRRVDWSLKSKGIEHPTFAHTFVKNTIYSRIRLFLYQKKDKTSVFIFHFVHCIKTRAALATLHCSM